MRWRRPSGRPGPAPGGAQCPVAAPSAPIGRRRAGGTYYRASSRKGEPFFLAAYRVS